MTAPLCPRCKTNERAPRRTGGFRSWCRSCESSQKVEYCRTEAGRATYRRWYHKAFPQPERTCGWCGTSFQAPRVPGYSKLRHCSKQCADSNLRHKAALRKSARSR